MMRRERERGKEKKNLARLSMFFVRSMPLPRSEREREGQLSAPSTRWCQGRRLKVTGPERGSSPLARAIHPIPPLTGSILILARDRMIRCWSSLLVRPKVAMREHFSAFTEGERLKEGDLHAWERTQSRRLASGRQSAPFRKKNRVLTGPAEQGRGGDGQVRTERRARACAH